MVKEVASMKGATDLEKQNAFLAEQARKVVQTKAMAQCSSVVAVQTTSSVQVQSKEDE